MSPFVAAHALGASLSLTLGAATLLRRRRGDRLHRLVGRVWVVLMYWTILSSFFIRELDPGHLSWIHGLSAFTFVTLSIGLASAMTHRVAQHRHMMVGSYLGLVGAFLGAVVVPQRAIPTMAVDDPLQLGLAVLAVAGATGAVLLPAHGAGRRDRDAQSSRPAAAKARA